jgi:hypothetical protein
VLQVAALEQTRHNRFCRYSDYYISGCKLSSKGVGASFLMSYVACGRPFPVTRLPGIPLPLSGKPCDEQSPCGGGIGRHDSHYACVKLQNGQYYPCPAREQPDYDEIVVFNPNAVLPVASFEFKRRRRTLLWADANMHFNYQMLLLFPGCPQNTSGLQAPVYPMQHHCKTCMCGLTMDPNPYGTFKDRQKFRDAAQADLEQAQKNVRHGDAVAQCRLDACKLALKRAEADLAPARAVKEKLRNDFHNRDIPMEDQTDVVLFTSVHDITQFLRSHPELSK